MLTRYASAQPTFNNYLLLRSFCRCSCFSDIWVLFQNSRLFSDESLYLLVHVLCCEAELLIEHLVRS